jgi:hypothetical protein
LGSSSLFNWSKGMTFKPTLDCKIAWRIEWKFIIKLFMIKITM